jgi:hypothetical protein
MKMRMLSSMFVFFAANIVLAVKPAGIQYISPVDNSTLNSRTSGIIIRPGEKLGKASIDFSGQIVVTDKANKRYSGGIVLSSDGKTLIFKPDGQYNAGEDVHVAFLSGVKDQSGNSIPSFTFQFTVTPLAAPLDPKDYLSGTGDEAEEFQKTLAKIRKTTTDELPVDFPRCTVITSGTPADGSIFISPSAFTVTDGYNVMMDNSGTIQYWKYFDDATPVDFKVLPNGYLSYGAMYEFSRTTGGGPTVFRMMDNSYTVVDSFKMGNGYIAESHEFQLLPNGHAIMLSYDLQPFDMSKIIPGGHPGATPVGSIIQELDVDKNVVFQWRSWDHLNIKDSYSPELTKQVFDPIHVNSIDMTQDNHLLVSLMAYAGVAKISRQTGQILWTMGGSLNSFTFINEDEVKEYAPQYFMYQHDVRMLANGNITMIDDGDKDVRNWARAVEYQIDETAKTATKVWQYRHNPDMLALGSMGTAQRLSNGNTFIGWGQLSAGNKIAATEVDPAGNVVLEVAFKDNLWTSYRAYKFDWKGGAPAAEVLVQRLTEGEKYEFNNDGGDSTGVTIKTDTFDSFGYNEMIASRYNYAPLKPEFSGKTPIVLPYRIVLHVYYSFKSFEGTIRFNADFYGIKNPDSVTIYYREEIGSGKFIALPTSYNPATKELSATYLNVIDSTTNLDPTTEVHDNDEFIFAYADNASQTFPPLLVSPLNNADANISHVKLEWTPVGYADSYSLQVATDAGFTSLVVDKSGLTEAVYMFDGSAQGPATYYWRVKTANDAGASEWATAQVFNTKQPYIKVTSPNGGEKLNWGRENFITWTSITGEKVVIELLSADGSLLEVIRTTQNSGGYAWEVPTDLDTMKLYKIRIKDAANEAIYDESDAAFGLTFTGIISEYGRSEIKITDFQLVTSRPFNSTAKIRYQLAAFNNVELSIYSVLGKKVATLVNKKQSAGSYEVTFNTSGLAPTVYFFKFRAGENFIQTRKLVLMK